MTPQRRIAAPAVLVTAAALALTACSSSSSGSKTTGSGGGGSSSSSKVNLVGYSVPKPAYDALQAAFQQTSAGKGVTFSDSYGPSGSQSKAVAAGQPADYVAFSTGSDMSKLVPSHVAASWDQNATKGIVSDSVVVLVVRKGNPKHITGWDDLAKPGIKVVTPDPASSGSAKWNVLAAYEHVISQGGSPTQAAAYLSKFFKNAVSKPASGSDAMTTFLGGTGDVLVSYEDEAINARQKGDDVEYIVPKQSMLIETPAAVTKTAPAAARKFLTFVLSSQGQQIFASKGFRPVAKNVSVGSVKGANDPAHPFPTVPQLTTISQLGGWSAVNDKFFDDKNGLVTKIENAAG
jgi:sulfate transport system substrate-binding protein